MNESVSPQLTVTRWIDAFNAHAVEAIVALYSEDAQLLDSGMPQPRRGRAAIEGWFRWRFRSTPITYTPVEQIVQDDEQCTVVWIARGRGPRFFGLQSLSLPFEVKGRSVFTLREGSILSQEGTYDHLSVLRQILLPPLCWLPYSVLRQLYKLYLWRNRQL